MFSHRISTIASTAIGAAAIGLVAVATASTAGASTIDDAFIALARSVYKRNDERGQVKRALNLALGSGLIEEKSYKPY